MRMSQEEQLITFFVYSMFIYPCTNWLVSPKRPYAKWKGATYAMLFLVAISGCHIMYENREKGPNYHEILQFSRGDSFATLKRNFHRISLELHPDKNKDPAAIPQFRKAKQAYEALVKTDKRRIYNLYGEEGLKKDAQGVVDHKSLIINMLVYYVSTAISTFLMTISEPSGAALSMSMFGLSVVLLLEMILILEEVPVPVWFFPNNTSYEMVKLIQRLFPAFMNGMRCICGAFHVDEKAKLEQHLEELQSSSKQCTLSMMEVSDNITSNPTIVEMDDSLEKEGLVERGFRESRVYQMDNTEAKEIIQRQVDLIADPVKLDAYMHNKKNEVWEWLKYISIYLFVRHVWKQIAKETAS